MQMGSFIAVLFTTSYAPRELLSGWLRRDRRRQPRHARARRRAPGLRRRRDVGRHVAGARLDRRASCSCSARSPCAACAAKACSPWPPVDPVVDELERRLRRLRRIFDLSRLEGQGAHARPRSAATTSDSRLGYRFVHSDLGAMHMALNPGGIFDPRGLRGPGAARRRSASSRGTRDVLELACGNGYNLVLLAERNPSVRFVGVDLVAAQVRRAQAALADLPLADAVIGDFQSLAFGDASQDAVYVVESLCHATDLPRALRARSRACCAPAGGSSSSTAGGRPAFDDLPAGRARGDGRGRARDGGRRPGSRCPRGSAVAGACGLRVVEELDLTAQIAPEPRAPRGARGALRPAPARGTASRASSCRSRCS